MYICVEFFTAVKFHVEVYWVVTPRSVAVGYPRFRIPCCLVLQGEEWTSENWYPTTTLHGVTTQKTSTCNNKYLFIILGRSL
jgi:hypothetical protein